MRMHVQVSAALLCGWIFGLYQFSWVWIFLMILALFIAWMRVQYKENVIHRKRPLRQSETGEWINFIVNRWWVFSADSIENIVKELVNERLTALKPNYVSELQLVTFTFGDTIPAIEYVYHKAFGISEGVPDGRRPMDWQSIFKPSSGLDHTSSHHVAIEIEMNCHCQDFLMTFRSNVVFLGANIPFNTTVDELEMSANLRVTLHMSKDDPFPHVSMATISFLEKPNLRFNIRTLNNVFPITAVPLLKSWIRAKITDDLTKDLVDPNKIEIPIAKAGLKEKLDLLKERSRITSSQDAPDKTDQSSSSSLSPFECLDVMKDITFNDIHVLQTAPNRQWSNDLKQFPPLNFHQLFVLWFELGSMEKQK